MHLQNAESRPEGKGKGAKFKSPEEVEHLPRLGQEAAGEPAKERDLISEVASQRDVNNAGKKWLRKTTSIFHILLFN